MVSKLLDLQNIPRKQVVPFRVKSCRLAALKVLKSQMTTVRIIAGTKPLKVFSRKIMTGTICHSTGLYRFLDLVNPLEPGPSSEILLPFRCFGRASSSFSYGNPPLPPPLPWWGGGGGINAIFQRLMATLTSAKLWLLSKKDDLSGKFKTQTYSTIQETINMNDVIK